MKFKFRFLLALGVLLLFAACQKEEIPGPSDEQTQIIPDPTDGPTTNPNGSLPNNAKHLAELAFDRDANGLVGGGGEEQFVKKPDGSGTHINPVVTFRGGNSYCSGTIYYDDGFNPNLVPYYSAFWVKPNQANSTGVEAVPTALNIFSWDGGSNYRFYVPGMPGDPCPKSAKLACYEDGTQFPQVFWVLLLNSAGETIGIDKLWWSHAEKQQIGLPAECLGVVLFENSPSFTLANANGTPILQLITCAASKATGQAFGALMTFADNCYLEEGKKPVSRQYFPSGDSAVVILPTTLGTETIVMHGLQPAALDSLGNPILINGFPALDPAYKAIPVFWITGLEDPSDPGGPGLVQNVNTGAVVWVKQPTTLTAWRIMEAYDPISGLALPNCFP